MKKISIKRKLIALTFIILIPLITLQSLRIKSQFDNSIEAEFKASQEFAEAISLSFTNYLEEIWTGEYAMGQAIVSNPDWSNDEIEAYMKKILLQSNGIIRYSWINPEGIFTASTSAHFRGLDVHQRDYYQEIIKGKEKVISNLTTSYRSNEIILPVARGIRIHNVLKGIIVGIVDVERLHTIIPISRIGKTGSFGIIDKNGMVVYRNGSPGLTLNERSISSDSPMWKSLGGEIVRIYDHKCKFDSLKRMGINYPIKQIGWACFANVSVSEVLSKHLYDLRRDIFALIIVVIGSFIMAGAIGNRIINPINKLKEAAEEISKGNMQVRTNFSGDDELAATSQAFDRMTEDINQLIFETEEYGRLKSRFFATISHELKTPLNIVLASVQLIEKLNIDDSESYYNSMKKYIKMLKQNSLRLLRLINNLIDINKIEGNHMAIQLVNCDMVEVVEDIALSVVDYTKSKDIELIFDTEVEEKIMAFDPEKIERIMLNLLSNAIKFTDPGGKIDVNIYDKGEKVLVSVRDTGIGIPEDMHGKIFDYFTRVDSSFQRKTEGSGIGLSLVKSLVELHGGSIAVKSQCGKGSEFIVELPVKLLSKDESHYEELSLSNKERINVEFSDIYL